MSAKKRNLDAYLIEVFKQHIAIADVDYTKSKEIFDSVFNDVKKTMGEQCNYFKKYSSEYFYAGSVSDDIKVSKLDEFDMDIVIRLPICYKSGEDGIIIENEKPGFVKLKIMKELDNLDKQQGWEEYHKILRDWRDAEKYLLQSKMRDWMQSVVKKAVNSLKNQVYVEGEVYKINYRHAGPAITLNVQHSDKNNNFVLDVDLVPVIRFQYPSHWLEGYRKPLLHQPDHWYVVPKPDKTIADPELQNRCWRLSFQKFERDIIKNRHHLKTSIRLVKKLRDALKMKAIASYYIKTLFLWKIHNEKNNHKYWQNKISFLFREMVQELHDAIKNKNIPYYWNESHNLIQGLKDTLQKQYITKLKEVLNSIDGNNVDQVVASLLTQEEQSKFKLSPFYQRQHPFQEKIKDVVEEYIAEFNGKLDSICDKMQGLILQNQDLRDEVVILKSKLRELEENKTSNVKEEDLVNVGNAIDVLEFESEEREWDPDDNPKRVKLSDGKIGLAPKRDY